MPLDAALEVGHSQTSSPAGALTQRSQSLPKLPISHPRCIIREHWDLVEDATQPTDLLDSRTKIKQGTGQLLVPPRIHRPRLIRLPRGAKLPDYGGLPGRSRAIADRAAGQSLLAAHRNYLTYHSDACELAKGMPPGSQLEWYAVISAARACMQSEGLLMALRVGLDQFRLADIRARDQPDARLALLLGDSDRLWAEVTATITSQLDPTDQADSLAWLTAVPNTSGADANGVDEAV